MKGIKGDIWLVELPESVKVTAVKHKQDFSLVADTCLMLTEVVKHVFCWFNKPWIV